MLGLTLAFALFALVSGLGIFIAVLGKFNDWHRFVLHAVEVPGKVVDAGYEQPGDALPNSVTIEFQTREGEVRRIGHTITGFDAMGDSALETLDKGSAVSVLYDPHHPADARLKTDGEPTLPNGLGFVLGAIFILWGLSTLLGG